MRAVRVFLTTVMFVFTPVIGAQAPPTDNFEVLWAVENVPNTSGKPAGQWAESIDFGNAPIRRDVWILHEAELGFPVEGPHVFDGNTAAELRLRSSIRRAVSSRVQDPHASGYGILDIETWQPVWSMCSNIPSSAGPLAKDRDFKDDWRRFVQDRRPRVLDGVPQEHLEAAYARSFDTAARRLFEMCIEECRRTRPGVRWGFYMYPPRFAAESNGSLGAPGVDSGVESGLDWLYDTSDALFPDLCPLQFTIAEPEQDREPTENSPEENLASIEHIIVRAMNAAKGKPVVPVVWLRYPRTNKQYGDKLLNITNLRQSLEGSRNVGAAGVAFWDVLHSSERTEEVQSFVTRSLVPMVSALHGADGATSTEVVPAVMAVQEEPYSTGRMGVVVRRAPGVGPGHGPILGGRRAVKVVGRDSGQRVLNILGPPIGFTLNVEGTDAVLHWQAPKNGATGVQIQRRSLASSGLWVQGASIDVESERIRYIDAPGFGVHEYRIASVRDDAISAFTNWLRLEISTGQSAPPDQPGSPPTPPNPGDPTDPPNNPPTPPNPPAPPGNPAPPTDPPQPPIDEPPVETPPPSRAPAMPMHLAVIDAGNELEVRLSWSESTETVDGFQVQRRSQQAGGSWAEPFVLLSGAGTTRMVDRPGLGLHEYRIAAFRGGLVSDFTSWNQVAVRPNVPESPSAFAGLDAGNGRDVELSWVDNSTNETDFLIERQTRGSGGAWDASATLTAAPNSTRWIDSPGIGTHQYRIAARNGAVLSTFASWQTVPVLPVAPTPPTQFTVSDVGNGRDVSLAWTNTSGDDTEFLIERQTRGGDGLWGGLTARTAAANASGLIDSPGVGTHQYRIAARIGTLVSIFTTWQSVPVVPVAPSPPTNFTVSDIGNGRDVSLSWSGIPGNQTEFRIERQTRGADGAWGTPSILSAAANATGLIDAAGVGTHQYRIAASNGAVLSVFTSWLATSILPVAPSTPSNFAVVDAGNGRDANLTWTDTSSNETAFQIERQTQNAGGIWGSTTVLSAAENATQFIDAAGSGTHQYRIASRNGTLASIYTDWKVVTIVAVPPTAPTSLKAVDAGNGRDVTLTWEDNSNNETDFRLERQTQTSPGVWGPTTLLAASANITRGTDNPGVGTHRYRICARNGTLPSPFTPWQSVIVRDVAPSPPSGLDGRDEGNERDITLTWADNATNETGFTIERQARIVDGTWGSTSVLSAPANATRLVDSPGSGTFQYRVAAVNAAGASAFTGWVTVSASGGWTQFPRSADTIVIHVSSSTGNDSNNGLSEAAPVRTLLRARDLVRNNYPDWILLKRGDTFNDYIRTAKGGRSASEPMLYGAYGEGDRPVVIPPSNQAGVYVGSGAPGNIAIVGLHIKAGDSGNSNSGFHIICGASRLTNVLIEDCYVEQFKDNMNIQGNVGGTNRVENVTIRRTIIADAFPNGSAHSQGAFIDFVDGLLIEECLIDRNGWRTPTRSDATVFNHDLYISSGNTGRTVIRNNIISRASSHGLQLRSGGVIEGNVFALNPISMQLGGGDPSPHTHTHGITGAIRNNIVLEGVDINSSTPRGQGIYCLNIGTQGAVIEGNIVANNAALSDVNAMPLYCMGASYGSGVGYNNLSIRQNIFYNWRGPVQMTGPFTTPPSPSAFSGLDGNVFEGNDIQVPNGSGSGRPAMVLAFSSLPEQITFRHNTYFSSLPDGQRLQYGGRSVSLESWLTSTQDTGSTYNRVMYVDPDRTLAMYHASIGGGAATESFLEQARRQRRGAWRSEYSAPSAAGYIRAGFVVRN